MWRIGFCIAWFVFAVVSEKSVHANDEALTTSQAIIDAYAGAGDMPSPGQVVVVYFTPSDREPAKDHTARIRRIVEVTADFYQRELIRHGLGDRTMRIHRDQSGAIDVIDVKGALADRQYGKQSGSRIRQEVLPSLRTRGIQPQDSVLLIFCNMMDYDAKRGTIAHHSPYYGGGSYLGGTAWQCDSEILDPRRFTDRTPIRDGEYGNITIGRHNSIFIGGVVHELGHALSLPHCRERWDQRVQGTALMGSGNRTFRQELRGEGKGTFLTPAHAMRLAAHPVFLPRVSQRLRQPLQVRWEDLSMSATRIRSNNGDGAPPRIQVEGKIQSNLPVHGIIAYFDREGGGDYDATTATAFPADGVFSLTSGRLPAGNAQLRLVACGANGATATRKFAYQVNRNGQVDMSMALWQLQLRPVAEALVAGGTIGASQVAEGRAVLNRLSKEADFPGAETAKEALDEMEEYLSAKRDTSPHSTRNVLWLTQLKPTSEKVGWMRPSIDRLPVRGGVLSIAGRPYASGFYAHAPSEYRFDVGGLWDRITGKCGLQDGHNGRVQFEIYGDNKRLWSSGGVGSGPAVSFDIPLGSVKTLRLVVTDGGNGTASDWGVWTNVQLQRTSRGK